MRNRVGLGFALAFGLSSLVFAQANIAGKWTGEMAGGRGAAQPVTLELTVSGSTVTGKLTQGQGMPVDITNAKLEGDTFTFSAAGGGGGGGRGGGRGGPGAGGPGGDGAAPAPAAGGPGGGGGGGFAFTYTAKISGNEMSVTREAPAAPAGGAPAAGGPGGGGGGRGGGRGGGPVTFTLKKG